VADRGQAREHLVPAKSKAVRDSLPSCRPLKAVSGAQLVRVRSSLRFEFRVGRDSAGAIDSALANAAKKSVAQLDGASARDLKAGLAQAQAGMGAAPALMWNDGRMTVADVARFSPPLAGRETGALPLAGRTAGDGADHL
jgi:hypothetical protein